MINDECPRHICTAAGATPQIETRAGFEGGLTTDNHNQQLKTALCSLNFVLLTVISVDAERFQEEKSQGPAARCWIGLRRPQARHDRSELRPAGRKPGDP